MLPVNLCADPPQAAPAPFLLRLESQPDPDHLERVGDQHAGDPRRGPARQPSPGRLLRGVADEEGAELLVRQKLDGCVGEDLEEGGGVAAEETERALAAGDVAHGFRDAEPGAGVLGVLWGGGLEEDLYAVEGRDDGFGLRVKISRLAVFAVIEED